MMNTLNIRISDKLRRDLEKLCREQDQPVSDAAPEVIKRYVAAERFQALRRKTLPFAEAQRFSDG